MGFNQFNININSGQFSSMGNPDQGSKSVERWSRF